MDRENVIRGLECCMIPGVGGCDECPYVAKGMCQELLGENAIALLKAQERDIADMRNDLQDTLAENLRLSDLLKTQEPRVMNVEEVVGCVILERNITLWFEFRNEIKSMNTKDIVYNDFLSDEDFPTLTDPNLEWVDGGKRDGVIIAEYNDTFRCWTSVPTDEQREATPWMT